MHFLVKLRINICTVILRIVNLVFNLAEHQYSATHAIDCQIHIYNPSYMSLNLGPFSCLSLFKHYCGQVIYLHLGKGLLKTLQMMEQTTGELKLLNMVFLHSTLLRALKLKGTASSISLMLYNLTTTVCFMVSYHRRREAEQEGPGSEMQQ